ncbi:MAG: tetratricopeptide repeat protein [Rhodothermales bacterium]
MRIANLITLMLLLARAASAGDIGSALQDFDQGNQRYRDGDYRGALAAYERVLQQGYESGVLYYNTGNAYFRTDEIGQAIRYYEKARRFVPKNPELLHNLTIARTHVDDEFSRVPEPFWRPAWQSVARILGAGGLFVLGMLFYVAGAVVLAMKIRSGPSPWRRRILVVAAVGTLLFVALSFYASLGGADRRSGVIIPDEVTLMTEPGGSESDHQIHEGLVVDIASERGEWLEVRLPNGTTGWLLEESVGEI